MINDDILDYITSAFASSYEEDYLDTITKSMADENKQNGDPSASVDSRSQEEESNTNSSWFSKLILSLKKSKRREDSIILPESEVDLEILRLKRKQYLEQLKLQKYHDFLERLACDNSSRTFSNGGIEHAAILMSVLFRNTKNEARVYCIGFRPNLITRPPYWESLNRYLDDPNHILKVLVETDEYVNELPIELLRRKKEEREREGKGETIIVKKINEDSQKRISALFGDDHCNFAIFDNEKYRYEYDPENFKAYGSFNQPDNCEILTEEFESAFSVSTVLV